MKAKLFCFLENKKVLVSAGLILAALTVGMLIPCQADPDKLQSLLERGNYQAVREGAEQILAREPEAHSVRAMLIRSNLAEGRYAEAMEHALSLAGAGWDMTQLEFQFNGALPSIAAQPETSSEIVTLVAAELDKHQHWNWLKAFGLKVLTEGEAVGATADYFAALSIANMDDYNFLLLVEAAWQKAADSDDWDAAWRTATALDSLMGEGRSMVVITGPGGWPQILDIPYVDYSLAYPGFTYRTSLVLGKFGRDEDRWTALQSAYPQDPLLAVGRSKLDLDWLVEWEGRYGIDEEYASIYSFLKAQVLAQASRVDSSHFANITPWHLLGAALSDVYDTGKLRLVLDYLRSYPEMAEDIESARLALALPEPKQALSGLVGFALAQDGKGLIRETSDLHSGEAEYTYFDLASEEEEEFVLPLGNYYWSPDGSHVAIDPWYEEDAIKIYNNRGELAAEFPQDMHTERVGWKDADNLWLVKRELEHITGTVLCLYTLNIADGGLLKVDDLPRLPQDSNLWFGPKGRVAWSHDQDLRVYDGEETTSFKYKGSYVRILSWRPDGKGMVAEMDGKHYYYTGDGGLQELNLPAAIHGIQASWVSNDEIAWAFPLCGQTMLGFYNVNSGQVTMTGIVNPVGISGNYVLATDADELLVYELEQLRGAGR